MTAPRPAAPRPAAERQRTGLRTQTETERGATEAEKKPSLLERQRAKHHWLDHLLRAATRYSTQKGDFYAAGITYYTVLALVPIIMVAVAALGFALAGDAARLMSVQENITSSVPGNLQGTVKELVQGAIKSRTSVGVVGLVGALYAGLGWMNNIRTALTAQWEQEHTGPSFLKKKILDLGALVGLFLALVASVLLSALGSTATGFVLELVHLNTVPGAFLVTRLLAIALSIAATWAVFTWVIARLPREAVSARSGMRAALLAAVAFEVLKQIMAFYLPTIVKGPAGTVFGPVLGILVFVFFTSRVLLFSTAWAATAPDAQAVVEVPGPAVVSTQVQVSAAPSARGVLAGMGIGVVAALGLTHWRRR